MSPSSIPKLSLITFAMGAKQLVVQDALLRSDENKKNIQIYLYIHVNTCRRCSRLAKGMDPFVSDILHKTTPSTCRLLLVLVDMKRGGLKVRE